MLGFGLLFIAALMIWFTVYALVLHEPIWGFLVSAIVALIFALPLLRSGSIQSEPRRREAFASILALWLIIPVVGAIPFWISGHLTPLNSLFESMSGFTTTGATVLQDFNSFSKTLFMWRALTQWIGGIGIIVLFIAVFPQLAIAGRQLFFAEAPGPTEERLTPRLRHTSNAVLLVYVSLTVLCIAAYKIAGMSFYDAVAHAFTTISAGGFSPNGQSFAGYSPILGWICVIFMFFAGANFALQFRAINGKPRALLNNLEFRAYIVIILLTSALLSIGLLKEYGVLEALRHATFEVLSIITTAGYASVDFAQWPQKADAILLVLMFIGGSAGSAAGGVKIVRWLMLSHNVQREIKMFLHPNAIIPIRLGKQVVDEKIMRSVTAFLMIYIGVFAVSTMVLTWFGADFITAFTASIACLGNIGPGLASVGPMESFAELPAISREILIFDMYAGRLEIVTVFIIFSSSFWSTSRRNRLFSE